MKWQRGHRSKHVEDRRGQPARGGRAVKVGAGVGVVGVLIVLLGQVLGIDLSGLSGTGGETETATETETGTGTGTGTGAGTGTDPDAELVEFIHFVIDDIQETFAKELAEDGKTYRPANLVIFTEEVDTQCGLAGAAVGPFYCPPDERAFIDLSFYKVLRDRLGAGGDFAQAYVLAHEIGHHLQHLLGTDERVRRESRGDKARASELSVRQELQADCYAGVWASSTAKRDLLQQGDIEESVNAAAQIGDDRLQKMAGQKVNPETWTHGSSAQRVQWFETGLRAGDLDACDTF